MASNAGKKKNADTKKNTSSAANKTRKQTAGQRKSSKTAAARPPVVIPEDIPQEKPNPMIAREAVLWLVLAVCLFLFISCFGIGGYVGGMISDVLFGLFGICAWLFPALLFLAAAFWLSNRGSAVAWLKFGSAVLLYLCICSFAELFAGTYDSPRLFFQGAATKQGGGLTGGAVCRVLCPALGEVGTGVLFCVLVIICLVLITQKSLIRGVRRQGSRVYHSAKESSRRRREGRRPEGDGDFFLEDPLSWPPESQELPQEPEREERYVARTEGMKREPVRTKKSRGRIPERGSEQPEERQRQLDVPVSFPVQQRRRRAVRRVSGVSVNTRITGDPEAVASEIHEIMPKSSGRAGAAGLEEPEDCFIDLDAAEHPQAVSGRTASAAHRKATEPKEPVNLPETFHIEGIEPEAAEAAGTVAEAAVTGRTARRTAKTARLHTETAARQTVQTGSAEDLFAPEQEDWEESVQSLSPDMEQVSGGGSQPQEAPASEPEDRSGTRKRNPRSTKEEMEAGIASVEAEMEEAARQPKPEYIVPPVDLLKKGRAKSGKGQEQEVRQTAAKLQQTLNSFGVHVTVTNVSCGPSVTRYELLPEQGVKVSRIVALSNDIKLNLAAADIRIEAPIPGKAAVGIEVPNAENSTVALRDLIESEEFQNHSSNLAFATGKDIGGRVVVSDIAKMPHLLIAGATGSGKSVCINTLIISILYKAKPDEVKLIMIDPKVVELSVYNGIPHLFIPVVTDPKKAAGALNWAVAEMTDRYNKFAEYGVRDLKGYNQKVEAAADPGEENGPQKLPQIVIIVDELADLMMVAPGEVEDSICRLAQLARAAGIHLIIATQRPSVNVITGLIKANMPSRIAFAVSSGVDSRTIIDMNGAEKLLGKGDMLFYPQGYQKPARVQGAFVSDEEVADVVDFLKGQDTGAAYSHEMEEQIAKVQQAASAARAGEDNDELFAEAGKFIIEKDKASIGMLQRVFKIGFNRAARIMDQLSDAGVVGPEEGTKPRRILMSAEQFENYLEENGG